MSSVAQIRTALKTTVSAAIPSLFVYDTVADAVNLPALIVEPAASDFAVAMGRGTDTHTFNLYVLTSWREAGLAQNDLDAFVTGAGALSIRAAVFATPRLGLADSHANVTGMRNYGASFTVGDIDCVGAVLEMVVHTSGTA
jgi:hypothetical protein